MARVAAKWAIRKLAERLTGTTILDLNSGLSAFHRHTALPYLHLLPPGFSCVTPITLAFLADQHPFAMFRSPMRLDAAARSSVSRAIRTVSCCRSSL
jgi:hypothetical protein